MHPKSNNILFNAVKSVLVVHAYIVKTMHILSVIDAANNTILGSVKLQINPTIEDSQKVNRNNNM